MIIGYGALIVSIAMTTIVLSGFIKRWPIAPMVLVIGGFVLGYWCSVQAWNVWAPMFLLRMYYFWGIAAMMMLVGGAIGTLIYVVRRGMQR